MNEEVNEEWLGEQSLEEQLADTPELFRLIRDKFILFKTALTETQRQEADDMLNCLLKGSIDYSRVKLIKKGMTGQIIGRREEDLFWTHIAFIPLATYSMRIGNRAYLISSN